MLASATKVVPERDWLQQYFRSHFLHLSLLLLRSVHCRQQCAEVVVVVASGEAMTQQQPHLPTKLAQRQSPAPRVLQEARGAVEAARPRPQLVLIPSPECCCLLCIGAWQLRAIEGLAQHAPAAP